MSRVYNFSPGPAALPLKVLERIREDIPDWSSSGMSIMEVSHRSKTFMDLAEQAEQNVRDLLSISNDYSVLFLQGGATLQFAMTPLNLSQSGDVVDYVQTGIWSKKAISEASRFCTVNIVADSSDSNFCHIPLQAEWRKTTNAAYFHYTANETITGVEFHFIPETGEVPLRTGLANAIMSKKGKSDDLVKKVEKQKELKMTGQSKIQINPKADIGQYAGGNKVNTGNLH